MIVINVKNIQVGDIAVFNNSPITSDNYHGVVVKITRIIDRRTVEAIVPDPNTIKDGIDKWNDAITSDAPAFAWHCESIGCERLDACYIRSIIVEESPELDAFFLEMEG